MRRLTLAASLTLALTPATAAAKPACHRTYTLPMFKRAARATYSGTDLPRTGAYGRLHRYVRCQRNPGDQSRARAFWASQHQAWADRRHPPLNGPAIASWYDDAGTTGCGFHATYGIATFVVPCGGKVTLQHAGRTVVATRDDSGPYVSGRTFDLDPRVKAALGCSDLCSVYWR